MTYKSQLFVIHLKRNCAYLFHPTRHSKPIFKELWYATKRRQPGKRKHAPHPQTNNRDDIRANKESGTQARSYSADTFHREEYS